MSSMATAMVALDSLTLNIVQEIHVRASLEVTFETLLEQLGPRNEVIERGGNADEAGSLAGREMVPRFRRWERALLGTCASNQAADAAGVYGADVYVLSGEFQCAVPVERDGWRDTDQVSSHGTGIDSGRT